MIKRRQRFALYLFLYLALSSIAFAQVVEVPDSNLAQAIREELALPVGSEITVQDLQRLKILNAFNSDIRNLSGLEHAENLEYLEVWENPISDLAPVANLKRLEALDAGDCLISDITPVANLTALTRLLLSGNRLTDISAVANLTKLTHLRFNKNQISDISAVANLTQLTHLHLDGNQISDISAVANLTQLTHLHLDGNQIGDISPLANLTQLTFLSLISNTIVDISPLARLMRLEMLHLDRNQIADIASLANLVLLTELQLNNNKISDIGPFANLRQLTKLDLRVNQVTDITALSELTKLRELYLALNRISDVGPLAGLTALDHLEIGTNLIDDHSPLDGLSLTDFKYDQFCEMPSLPLEPRLENRNYPSAFGAKWIFGHDSRIDLIYGGSVLGMHLRGDGRLAGNMEYAIQKRDELTAMNPNMVFLIEIKWATDNIRRFGIDWPYWLRDANGKIIRRGLDPNSPYAFIDFTLPGAQDIIVQMAVNVSKCGLFDGIVFDSWGEHTPLLPRHLYSLDDGQLAKINEVQQQAKLEIVRRIRAATRPNFLIQVNSHFNRIPLTGPYINGLSMETGVPSWYFEHGYGDVGVALQGIADTLAWAEEHLREPRINGVAGEALGEAPSPPEPTDSTKNRRWVRVLTTLSMTHADGYVVYQVHDQEKDQGFWYDFLKADLGYPVSPTLQLYDEEIPGLYIREFTNGWAVYNHSGEAQTITLPEEAQGVASGLANTEHALPNLDGEMYLRVKPKNPADVNGDGVVNILDLTLVAQGFGTDSLKGDVNGDGVVNVFDLVFVANAF